MSFSSSAGQLGARPKTGRQPAAVKQQQSNNNCDKEWNSNWNSVLSAQVSLFPYFDFAAMASIQMTISASGPLNPHQKKLMWASK